MSFWKGLFAKSEPVKPMPHIALVFPARFPSLSLHVPEPNAHTTIMNLGTYDTVSFTPQDVIAALKDVPLNHMLYARVAGKEMFGPDKDVPVLLVQHDMLDKINASVTDALNKVGISDPSIYADTYKPHVTVSQTTWDNEPTHVLLTHAQLWWAGEKMNLDG